MTVKVVLEAPRPEATRISDQLEQRLCEEGAVIALSESSPDLWSVEVYLEGSDPELALSTTKDALGSDAFGISVRVEAIAEIDWVSEGLKALTEIKAGRFLVRGSHLREKPTGAQTVIEIDAGQAFGTGHHGTTAGCLAVLDRVMDKTSVVNPLDIGTGTGVLAIALAKRLRRKVTATDIDPIAIAVAQSNAELNHVSGNLHLAVANGTKHSLVRQSAPYDLVVANILAGPLMRMAPDICEIMAPGGTLVLSGLLPHQRSRVTSAFVNHGAYLERADQFDDWAVLTLKKHS